MRWALKFSNEMEAVAAPYKLVYEHTQKKAEWLKITSVSSFPSSMHHMSFDHHHNI